MLSNLGFYGIMFRILGLRVPGFKVLGFRVLGLRALGFRVLSGSGVYAATTVLGSCRT